MHEFIFYISYLAFPFLAGIIFLFIKFRSRILQNKKYLAFFVLLFFLSMIFIYARFVEPQLIFVKKTTIDAGFEARFVVVADPHLGKYKDSDFLQRIVDRVNAQENIDAVLIPGDLTYYPSDNVEVVRSLLELLSQIRFPVYAVLGNHDSEQPGPAIQDELDEILTSLGVTFLENNDAFIAEKDIHILGLGDKWADADDVSLINNFSIEDNLVVLAHNPDTVMDYQNDIADLTVSGHTHGGQIRLPFLYRFAIPCEADFDEGYYEEGDEKVFVSSGVGETALPMRLGVPPTIDILELK